MPTDPRAGAPTKLYQNKNVFIYSIKHKFAFIKADTVVK